jgi:hypothetical protein
MGTLVSDVKTQTDATQPTVVVGFTSRKALVLRHSPVNGLRKSKKGTHMTPVQDAGVAERDGQERMHLSALTT